VSIAIYQPALFIRQRPRGKPLREKAMDLCFESAREPLIPSEQQ